jgi:hypothetical protein
MYAGIFFAANCAFEITIVTVTGVHRISIPPTHARQEPIFRGDLNDFNANTDLNDIDIVQYWKNFSAVTDFQEKNMEQYWYNYLASNYEFFLSAVEIGHCLLTVNAKDPSVPKTFWQAMKDPEWAAAIAKEQSKFESNCCLAEVPDTGQHLVLLM